MKKILSLFVTAVFASALVVVCAGCSSQPAKPEPVNLDGKTFVVKETTLGNQTLTYKDFEEKGLQNEYFTIVVKSPDDVRLIILGVPYLANYEGEGDNVVFTITEAASDEVTFPEGATLEGAIDGDEITIHPGENSTVVVKETTSTTASK